MKKIKNLLLLALCSLATLTVHGQVNNAQDVIDMLTANGGHCQSVFYSASYQKDYAHDDFWKSTNNMWIKDSFGKGRFVQKLDENNQPVVKNVYDWQSNEIITANVVTVVDAFGGLFDWDLYIANADGKFVCTAQPSEGFFPVKNDDTKYVRLHMMSNCAEHQVPDYEVTTPTRKDAEWDISSDPHTLQLWTSINDIENYEWIGVTPWKSNSFDASLFMNAFMANRWYFLRLAVKSKGADGIIGTEDDTEDYHYDFYLAEFRHYNPNTIINDTHNGDVRSYAAIADYDEEQADGTTKFYVHNFSGFGPCYTQELGTEIDADLDALLEGTGLTQLNRGYGEGKEAEIHPITGYMGGDNKILIKRSENPAGFAHYHRAYEAIKNVEGVTPAQIEANKFNPAITTWHDCRIAGLVEGKFQRNADGKVIPESITALKDEVTGTWTDSRRHHHVDNGVASDATNPWVTDGGTCRTVSTKHLKIDPYVYCTDEQLAYGMNSNSGKSGYELYDYNDDFKRGGIYELIDIETTDRADNITLQLNIDNHKDASGNTLLERSMYKYEVTKDSETKYYLACPVIFDATANEQLVDHYEVCVYRGSGNNPVTVANDAAFADAESKLNSIMTPTATYILPKNETGHYEAFKLSESDKQNAPSYITTTHPKYSEVLAIEVDNHDIQETLTFYVKAVYTEESGLAPTYHSLQNVLIQVRNVITGVEDVNVESVKTVAGVYGINGQYMGNEIPATNGIYVVRYTDGSAAKVAIK